LIQTFHNFVEKFLSISNGSSGQLKFEFCQQRKIGAEDLGEARWMNQFVDAVLRENVSWHLSKMHSWRSLSHDDTNMNDKLLLVELSSPENIFSSTNGYFHQ
jgi:hypothetical protein